VERVRVQAMRSHGQDRLLAADLTFGMAENQPPALGVPLFGTHTTAIMPLDHERFSVHLEAPKTSKGSIFVMYRYADEVAAVEQAPWAWDFLDPFGAEVRDRKDRFYQFKVLTTQEAGERGFARFTIEEQGPPVYAVAAAAQAEGPSLSQRVLQGEEVIIRFEGCTQLGTIECGSDYRGRYEAGANRWTVTGFNLGDQAVRTVEAENAERRPGSLSVWGLLATYDEGGHLYYLGKRIGTFRTAIP
jgi:hypothetical protein